MYSMVQCCIVKKTKVPCINVFPNVLNIVCLSGNAGFTAPLPA